MLSVASVPSCLRRPPLRFIPRAPTLGTLAAQSSLASAQGAEGGTGARPASPASGVWPTETDSTLAPVDSESRLGDLFASIEATGGVPTTTETDRPLGRRGLISRRMRQPLRLVPGPPNFGLSLQLMHSPQSSPAAAAAAAAAEGGGCGGSRAGTSPTDVEEEPPADCARRVFGGEYVTVGASPIGLSPSSSNCKSSRSTRGGTSGVGSRSLHGAGKAPPASEPSAALSPLTIGTGAVRRVARGSARCICI